MLRGVIVDISGGGAPLCVAYTISSGHCIVSEV